MSIPYLLVPSPVADADVTAFSPGVEDATAAWAPGNFVIGDLCYRATTHRVYKRATVGTDAAGEYPELYPDRWQDLRPTNKWAPFDVYTSTQASAPGTLSYTINTGFANAVAVYGLLGDVLTMTVKDAPGGAVLKTTGAFALKEGSPGWYAYWFNQRRRRQITRYVMRDIPLSPTAELSITVTGATAAIGMIVFGDLRPLVRQPRFGTKFDARVKLVDLSYIKTDPVSGVITINKGRAARDMSIEVIAPPEDTSYILQSCEAVLGAPAAWIGSLDTNFDDLNVFGLGVVEMVYQSARSRIVPITVRGIV